MFRPCLGMLQAPKRVGVAALLHAHMHMWLVCAHALARSRGAAGRAAAAPLQLGATAAHYPTVNYLLHHVTMLQVQTSYRVAVSVVFAGLNRTLHTKGVSSSVRTD